VGQEEFWDGTVEHNDLHRGISFNRRDHLIELRDCFRPEDVEGRIVNRDPPVRRRSTLQANLLL
jgi:hypothetical protein